MNPQDLTKLADAVGATCHTHSMGRATSIMFSIHQLEQFAERLVAEEREKRIAAQTEAEALKVKLARSVEKRIAAQTEAEALKVKLARSGVEQNRAVHAAILKERETIVQLLKAHMDGADWNNIGERL